MATASLMQRMGHRLKVDLHPGQRKALKSVLRFVLILAGTQSGKTVFGPHWLRREIKRRGPGDYLVAAPTYPLLGKKALPEFLKLFVDAYQYGKFRSSPAMQFTFSTEGAGRIFGYVPKEPTNIYFGYAQKPDSLESMTVKAAWLDEAGQADFKLGSWEAIQRRLAVHQGRCLITTTPYNLGWLKQQLYDPWVKAKQHHEDIDVISFDSTENPAFPQAEFERARRLLPAWKFDMFYRGRFTRPAGLIYDCFDAQHHVCPPFSIPDNWRRYLGLDFGGVNTAGVFFAEEPGTERLYLYREYKAGGRTAKGHAEALLDGEPGLPTACGGSKSEGQWRDEFSAAGLSVDECPVSEVEVGIDRVYAAFREDRVRIFNDCEGVLGQLQSYSRKLDANGEPTEAIDDKASFHWCFAAGTMVTTIDGQIPIESITPGTLVLTRIGYRPVETAGKTGVRSVRLVRFSNGAELIATGDHPIWVQGRGFVAVDALQLGCTVVHQESNPWNGKLLSSTASAITATPTPNVAPIESISSTGHDTCTVLSGSITTAQFRTATIFTTKTATQPTTLSKIFSLLREKNIWSITQSQKGGDCKTSWKTLSPRRLNGTDRQRVGRGTKNMPSGNGKAGSPSSRLALDVAKNTRPKCVASPSIAPWLARRQPVEEMALMPSTRYAVSAAVPFAPIVTSKSPTAPVHVVGVESVGHAPVYNLSVADQHEYYANGILVSNCDAMRYIIAWVRTGTGWENRLPSAPGSALMPEVYRHRELGWDVDRRAEW